MPCYHPLSALQLADGSVVFHERTGHASVRSLTLPCGQCVGCRLERSRQWAMRCVHEAKLHQDNCFITLTYDNDHLPPDLSLRYSDFQKFMKRLRKARGRCRFYMCGEYGEGLGRPHYHALLFGIDFPDKLYFKRVGKESILYTSKQLEALWPFGFSLIGSVTFESAAYCARYCVKKINGREAEAHYRLMDKETGEILGSRVPEFSRMSLKPGIGGAAFERYAEDWYRHDEIVVRGVPCKPTRYYDKLASVRFPERFPFLQLDRELRARRRFADNSDERLAVKEHVAEARLSQFKRNAI